MATVIQYEDEKGRDDIRLEILTEYQNFNRIISEAK